MRGKLAGSASIGPRDGVASNSKGVSDFIDVVEPCCDQSNLQNSFIIEACSTKFLVVVGVALRRVFGQLYDVIQHRAVLIADRRGSIIFAKCLHHFFVQRDSTQKLCVRFDSIVAPVRQRNHGGDHLVLATH